MKEFNYHSVMRAPQVQRVVLNMGLGEALTNARTMETAPEQMGMIAGQKPIITKARRSVAAFKVREGQPIGCAVTLRGRRMWDFLDRFLAIALPRIRDFRGVPRSSFDGQGNYSVGIREQIIFPEIDYNRLDRVRGLQVNIVTSAQSDHEGFRLLELLGMPFAREGQQR
jgi:large subunit ribosomal protein L5